jgi:hypothetical protein
MDALRKLEKKLKRYPHQYIALIAIPLLSESHGFLPAPPLPSADLPSLVPLARCSPRPGSACPPLPASRRSSGRRRRPARRSAMTARWRRCCPAPPLDKELASLTCSASAPTRANMAAVPIVAPNFVYNDHGDSQSWALSPFCPWAVGQGALRWKARLQPVALGSCSVILFVVYHLDCSASECAKTVLAPSHGHFYDVVDFLQSNNYVCQLYLSV